MLSPQQEGGGVQHVEIQTTDRPSIGPRWQASLPDQDRILRFHDMKNIVSCLLLVGAELRTRATGRDGLLGDRVLRACERLLQLGGGTEAGGRAACPSLPALLDSVAVLAGTLAGPQTGIETEGPLAPVARWAEMAVFRILLNLVSNAVRATNDCGGGLVRISADLNERSAALLITNDGVGLTVAQRPGGRSHTSSGLGLVIAEALANDLGGTLEMGLSRPGSTALRLVLPLAIFNEDD